MKIGLNLLMVMAILFGIANAFADDETILNEGSTSSGPITSESSNSTSLDNAPIEGKNNGEPKDDLDTPFSVYHENYFLLGYDTSDLDHGFVPKFQVSAKFSVPVKGVFFAYTQRTFMDFLGNSSPLYDNSYSPEAYYIFTFSDHFTTKHKLHYLKAGYFHESNGKDGLTSRSWERVYAEAEFVKGGFYIIPTVWVPFFKDDQNPDVEKYYGYGELTAGYIWENDVQLSAKGRLGTDLNKGNVRIDFSIPFRLFSSHVANAKGWARSYLWFQAFEGYGETFLGYNQTNTAVAAGFGFRPEPK